MRCYSYFFSVQFQIYFIREQLGGPRTVTKWEEAAMTNENLFLRIPFFVEIPLRLMLKEKTCGVYWVNHSPTGCFILCVQSLSIVTIIMDASKIKHADLVTCLVISTNQRIQLHITFIRCSQTFYCNILGEIIHKSLSFQCVSYLICILLQKDN